MNCGCFCGKSIGGSSWRRRGTAAAGLPVGIDDDLLREINHLSYDEIRSATNDFHPTNRIGRGGFGVVYKGTLRNGRQVAVKTLSAQSKQGVREFLNEIKTISQVRHHNLVELVGCCVQGTNTILVYEYVENNSLDRSLLGSKNTDAKLDWAKIISVSDPCRGYLAPEYALGGQLTLKADVYSFGVLILEIVSGRGSAKTKWGETQKLLVEWAWELYEEGRMLELVDPELGEFPEEEVIRYIKVAFFCTQAAANRRPIMSQVVDMLSRDIRLNEKLLTAPGFFQDSTDSRATPSSTKKLSSDSTSYQMTSTPVTITEVNPR
ncbi:hypothetical protein Tsubulata_013827 [Turnera subulata]|uniref:Protein kinase domain-containing protein n=1 Tax=Turnera subulata TaxID=218843 RepID=A0A9Q0GM64_9ROSI|nr:hypothetical protein Tsubulata_013827 [Turnera subulata]